MMKAYCAALGIPFNESLMVWPAGGDVMFTKMDQPQEDDLPEDVIKVVKLSMQYHDKLNYEQRFKY